MYPICLIVTLAWYNTYNLLLTSYFFDMQTLFLVILTILFIFILVMLFFVLLKIQKAQQPKEGEEQLFMMLQQQIQAQGKTLQDFGKIVDQKMTDTHLTMHKNTETLHKTIHSQFAENTKVIQGITTHSAKMIASITEKLTSLDKTNQQVVGFSEQLHNLERVLTNQKKRGALGEAGLQLILENMLPPTVFSMQYKFEDGDIVDAAIFAKDGIIPIDAKFSLDNYRRLIDEEDPARRAILEKDFSRDLKLRIDETSKYIKPKHGTLDFAFMFIPAEAIYYDLLVSEVGAVKVNTRNLIDYAFHERKVIIVSPTTFAAYLQTILQGLRSLKIEESAKSIRKHVHLLQKHLKSYEDFMKRLGNSMKTTVNHYNNAYKEFGKIDKDIVRITDGERVIDPEQIDAPQLDA